MIVDEAGNHRQRVRNGEQYVKPRGWHVTFVPSDDPVKVETLRWLFSTFADTDTGLRRLASDLNGRGIPGPTGGQWYAATIKAILENDKYTGVFYWGKRREGKYHRVVGTQIKVRDQGEILPNGSPQAIDNPRETWIGKEQAHEQLVDSQTFERVQAKLTERKRQQPNGEAPSYRTHTRQNGDAYMLTGLVYCAHCGRKMHGSMSTRKKNGKTYRYPKYICSTYCRSGHNNDSGCGYHNVQQTMIVDVILRKLREVVLAGGCRDRLHKAVKELLAQRSKPDHKQIMSRKQRVRDLDQPIDRAADRLLRSPEDLMDVLAPKLSAMKQERERAAEDLKRLEAVSAVADLDAEADKVVERLWSLGDEFHQAEPARLRELLRQAVSRIEL